MELQVHAAIHDIILDESGPVLELCHLLAVELLPPLVQVHHIRGLTPEPADLHVLGIQVWGQMARELHLFPHKCQDGLSRAYYPDLL